MNIDKLKEFIMFLKNETEISEDLLEKDFYIGILLQKLNNKEYAFKGGTCLSKIYLNYHRISEDLDFTFIEQKSFNNKSTKQIKKICSEKITDFGKKIMTVSEGYDFDFKPEKSNKKYIEIGSNNKLVTFKVWYRSMFTGTDSFIKIQITFLEIILFPVTEKTIKPLMNIDIIPEIDKKYFDEFIGFYKPIKYFAYDLQEIGCEKIRALLTRKVIKTRDVVDLYFIEKMHRIKINKLKDMSIKKIIFAIKNYEKYKNNFADKIKLSEKDFITEDAEHLMLVKIDRKDFDIFFSELLNILNDVKTIIVKHIN